MEDQQQVQILTLTPHEDGKVWVAEIIGEDPIYRLKRAFLPEINKGTYEIYDGYYQIHGNCQGITPFSKEYCIVSQGHMERRIPVHRFYQEIDKIKQLEEMRLLRVKNQIKAQLEEIVEVIGEDWIREEMVYQWEQVEMINDSGQGILGLSQLLKSKDKIIARYHKIASLRKDNY